MPEKNTTTRRPKPISPIDNTYGHMPPQAIEIEKLVLGALMIDSDVFSVVSEILHPETFYEPRNQKIYEAIQSLNMNEKPVDIQTIIEELKRNGTLESVGGTIYVMELANGVASSAHAEYHAHIIAQKYTARQLISYAGNIETKAFDESIDVDSLMQEAEGLLFELSQKNMKQDYTQVDPVIKQAMDLLNKAAGNEGGLTGVRRDSLNSTKLQPVGNPATSLSSQDVRPWENLVCIVIGQKYCCRFRTTHGVFLFRNEQCATRKPAHFQYLRSIGKQTS